LLVTDLGSFAVGLVPSYASIGIWGAVLLTIICLIQGIGVGGEWGEALWHCWAGDCLVVYKLDRKSSF
jgi:hypothetical protein